MALLDDGWMLDSASGAAPEGVRLLAACQAALNPEAARRSATTEAVFGGFFEAQEGAPLKAGALEAALDALDEAQSAEAPERPAESEFPAPLARVLDQIGRPSWTSRFGGYSEIVLDPVCEPGVNVRLLSIPPGKGAPEHDHDGEELTLVLSGSFADGRARYEAGDLCVADAGAIHHPQVDSEETCVCLAVEFGGLRPTNPALAALDHLAKALRRT